MASLRTTLCRRDVGPIAFNEVLRVRKLLVAIMAIPMLAGVHRAQAQGSKQGQKFTPEYGESLAVGKPACDLPKVTIDADFSLFQMPLDAGVIYLPKEFTTQEQRRPSHAQWMAPDRTILGVRVDSMPIGIMASGGANFQRSTQCILLIDGRHAVVDRVRITTEGDTTYVAMIPVFAASGRVINATIQAPSAERRDELLARLAKAGVNKQ
jgi:hypothetical protein